jgi:hypothetical protein
MRGAMVARHPYKGGQQYGDLPSGYFTDRVQLALQSVASELDEAAKLCGQIYVREEQPREQLQYEDVRESFMRDPQVIAEILRLANPQAPTALTLNPTTVKGGHNSAGTVTLAGRVPTGGTQVPITLLSSTPGVGFSADVHVLAGSSSVTFTVTTPTVTNAITVHITAIAAGISITAELRVTP